MNKKLLVGFALLLATGVVFFFANVHLGRHDPIQSTPDRVIDTWHVANVRFVTIINLRKDGLLNWERGFRCGEKSQVWENAIGYHESDYHARHKILFTWLYSGNMYYATQERIYAYPVTCNDAEPEPSELLLFTPAK